jgi:hypothetical protein
VGSTATATTMEGLTMTATETAIAGSTAMEGSMTTGTAKKLTVWKGLTATATAMECSMVAAMETTIDGSIAKEGSMATATAKKTAVAMAMEADGGLDGDGNGINNWVIGEGLTTLARKLLDSKELWRLFGTSRALTYVGLPASLVLRASEYISNTLCTLQAGGLTCVRAGTSRALTYV